MMIMCLKKMCQKVCVVTYEDVIDRFVVFVVSEHHVVRPCVTVVNDVELIVLASH